MWPFDLHRPDPVRRLNADCLPSLCYACNLIAQNFGDTGGPRSLSILFTPSGKNETSALLSDATAGAVVNGY